jgi:hypothetical protein
MSATISTEQFMEIMMEQAKTNTAILESIKELQKRNEKEETKVEGRKENKILT